MPAASGSTAPSLLPVLGSREPGPRRLRDAGLEHVQISIQDADDRVAERIAGVASVKQKRAAAALVQELGFAFSINVVLHRANLDRLGGSSTSPRSWARTAWSSPIPSTTAGPWRTGPSSCRPGAGRPARRRSPQEAMTRYRGRMQILFVLPDYFEQYPKAVLRRLGQALPRGLAGRARSCPVMAPRRSRPSPSTTCGTIPSTGSGKSRPRSTHSAAIPGCVSRAGPARARRWISGVAAVRPSPSTGAAENTDPVCILSPERRMIDEAIEGHEEPLEYRYRTLAGEPQRV